ncbi:MAG: ABC transporter ATP-binding protein [Candidatus Bathyarchaeota archaeon]|nr:ABC transporter ATP-binding protein [Candidatus Bathyarchaeota archaeon]
MPKRPLTFEVRNYVSWLLKSKINLNRNPSKKGESNMKESAITITNLTKKFEDKTALENLNLEVQKGELFGLLGPNGAGKTTTISIICGLLKPTSGTAQILGYDIQKDTQKVKEQIGVCIQETAIYPYLTGKENLELFGNLYGMNKKAINERSKMLLGKVGLTEDAKRVTAKYSGGMKRRLSLALALIHDPQIAFLDEPTVAMDPQSRHAVWDFIKAQKQQGKTIILTTHYMEEAQELCDRVGIIDHGKLIALGTPKELIAKNGGGNLEDVFIQLTGRNMREEI